MNTKKIANIGLLCAAAVVLGYVETLFSPILPVQGFKVGLANAAVMLALYKFGTGDAFFVMLVKVFTVCVWFSGLNALIFALSGGTAAFAAMCAAKKIGMSTVGTGMCGGVFHNIGQLVAAGAVMQGARVMYLAPILILLGLCAGAVVGVCTMLVLRNMR